MFLKLGTFTMREGNINTRGIIHPQYLRGGIGWRLGAICHGSEYGEGCKKGGLLDNQILGLN